MALELTLNGRAQSVETAPGETLLDVLRERLGVKSPKRGCSPLGQCGSCLVLVNGEPQTACTIPAGSAQGAAITTLEGIPHSERTLLADAFVRAGGVQCGFCLPGVTLRVHHFLGRHPDPTRAEIAAALDPHLCRCTGWNRIVEAIQAAARLRRGEALPAGPNAHADETPATRCEGGVGDRMEIHRGRELVLGTRPFVEDLQPEGLLYGAVAMSPHARARLVALDTARARAHPGVVDVVTAAEVPGERWKGLIVADWPAFVAVGEEARCVGDLVAAVAATSPAAAREAAALVEASWEPLPAVLSPEEALAPGAPQVNARHANLLGRSRIARGDVAHALATSPHVVSGTWQTQRIEHYFLEPECALAVPGPDGRLHLYSQGQGVFDDRRQVAALLGEPEENVFVELVPSGGAFGGKEDLSIQGHAALLARRTGRPVRVTLDRKESIRFHAKRHPVRIDLTVACDDQGRLTAVRARFTGDSGAYASVGAKVLERAAGHACGPYRVPNVDVESVAVYTNNPPCGAMRGFGANQAAFAIEGALDLLAEAAGVDRWEMRYRNAVDPGDPLTTGQRLEHSVGIKRTLLAVKDRYDAWTAEGRAVGLACGLKNTGLGNGAVEWGKARLVVESPDRVIVHQGYTDMGQGLFTVLRQFASEVTGLPASRFEPRVDATFALGCGQTTGSRATLFAGRAVVSAARKLRADLDAGHALCDLVGRVYAADECVDDTTPLEPAFADDPPGDPPGDPAPAAVAAPARIKTHTTYGFATQLVLLDDDGRVERVVAAHDVGRAVNPSLCEGQIIGAVHMGLGYALSEELPCVDGMPVSFSRYQLGILRARDMPPVEVVLVEEHEPEGPYGAKGLGEIGLVPTAAAVAGALAAYDGVRRTRLPMKDSPAARALSVGRLRTPHRPEDWR